MKPLTHRLTFWLACALTALTIGGLFGASTGNAATLLPNGKQVFLSANGTPLSGGYVYFYIPGTSTPKDTYQDAGQTILNTNPVVLDAAGSALIYGSGAYREIVTDSASNQIWDQLTADTSLSGIAWGGTSTGSANAQAVAAAAFAQTNGSILYFRAGFTNTGATTLNVNSTGGLPVYADTPSGPQALSGTELGVGDYAGVIYDSTLGAYHLLAPTSVLGSANTWVQAQTMPRATITGALTVGGVSLGGMATLTEMATPVTPSAGTVGLYGYAGDYLASQTPGGVQRLFGKDPTVQTLTSGTSYVPPAGVVRIRVRMVGGGGGGAADATNDGGNGGYTAFGSWVANGGIGGTHAGLGGPGGTSGGTGTGTLVHRADGARGQGGGSQAGGSTNADGGGGSSLLGFGAPGVKQNADGLAATGPGGGGSAGANSGTGGGGGGGEYVEFYVSMPGTTAYVVGAGGTGGTRAAQAGGAGAAGKLLIEEFYN